MKQLSNKPSRILSAEQNAAVFKMLQPNCKTLATAVATLFFYVNYNWVKQFSGVLCFERDTKKKKYYMRFYRNCFSASPEMVLQQKVKAAGVPFAIVRDQLFQMKIGCRSIGLQFVESPDGYEESSDFARALRGNLKNLKREAEARYYEEHPEKQKESRFKKIFHWRQRHKKEKEAKSTKLSPKDISGPTDLRHIQHLGSEDGKNVDLKDWTKDPVVKLMLIQMGLEFEHVLQSQECRQRVENMIKKHGGLQSFRNGVLLKGYGSQSVKRQKPLSPQQDDKAASSESDNKGKKKLQKQQAVPETPSRSDQSFDDSFDRSGEYSFNDSIRDTPMPMGELNESWFRVQGNHLDNILPSMPIWKSKAAPAKEATPACTPTTSVDIPTPPADGTQYMEEYEEAWLKVLEEDDSYMQPPPPVKRLQPPQKAPKRAQPSELLDEITKFDTKKAQKVPVMYTSSPKKPAVTPTVIPETSLDADVTPAESLAIELNKTIDEINSLTNAEKRARREKWGQKTDSKPQQKTDSSISETSSDSDSDSDNDEEQQNDKKA